MNTALVYRIICVIHTLNIAIAKKAVKLKKASTVGKEKFGKQPVDCMQFLCPWQDAPICVKLKFSDERESVIVRLMNKCERKYVKCNKGATAVRVPMALCDGDHAKIQNGTKRAKRSFKSMSGSGDEFRPIAFYGKKKKSKKNATTITTEKTTTPVFDDSLLAACPKSCKDKHHMICTKCSHGVYRTFLSICHLRSYQCRRNLPELEPLELITEDSCIYAAPYLTPPKKVVTIDKFGDYGADPVEWYYYCQKNNLTGKHPKCFFR